MQLNTKIKTTGSDRPYDQRPVYNQEQNNAETKNGAQAKANNTGSPKAAEQKQLTKHVEQKRLYKSQLPIIFTKFASTLISTLKIICMN